MMILDDEKMTDDIPFSEIKTVAECQQCWDVIMQEKISIEGQLDGADDMPVSAYDFDWRHRAKTALRHKKREFQMLQNRMGQLRRDERSEAERKREARLFNAMRTHIGEDVFMQIVRDIER